MTKMLRVVIAMTSLALSLPMANAAKDELCSIPPLSFAPAKTEYPDLAWAIEVVEGYSISTWYTDREPEANKKKMLDSLITDCPEESRLTIVVYGIPNKDCHGNYSSDGSVKDTATYETFLSDLTTAMGTRKTLYIVEPDSVGLLAEKDGCGAEAGYEKHLQIAIEALSKNPNAELYLDVGYWTIDSDEQLPTVVKIVKNLSKSGTLKGISLNTSNYRSNKELSELCAKFQKAVGSTEMNCIADTSRNYLEPTTKEWCNVLPSGIGVPPTSDTDFPNLGYYMWIKRPGESDGTCNGGPDAGKFFDKAFQTLWDEGYLVKELGMNTIAQGGSGNTSGNGSKAADPSQKPESTESVESGSTDSAQETPAAESEPGEKGAAATPSSETPSTTEELPEAAPASPTMSCKRRNRKR